MKSLLTSCIKIFPVLCLVLIGLWSASCTKQYEIWPSDLQDTLIVPLTALPGEPIKFEPVVTGAAYYYSWDFGDNSSARQRVVTHTYQQAGTYTISFKVYNYKKTDSLIKQSQIIIGTPHLTKIIIRKMPLMDPATGKYWHRDYGEPSPFFRLTSAHTNYETPYKKDISQDSLPLTYNLAQPIPIGGQIAYQISLYNKDPYNHRADEFMNQSLTFYGIPTLRSPYLYKDDQGYEIEYYFEF